MQMNLRTVYDMLADKIFTLTAVSASTCQKKILLNDDVFVVSVSSTTLHRNSKNQSCYSNYSCRSVALRSYKVGIGDQSLILTFLRPESYRSSAIAIIAD